MRNSLKHKQIFILAHSHILHRPAVLIFRFFIKAKLRIKRKHRIIRIQKHPVCPVFIFLHDFHSRIHSATSPDPAASYSDFSPSLFHR